MSKRITIRLGDEDYEQLQKRCRETSLDASFMIREALNSYLSKAGTTSKTAQPKNTGLAMPDEAFKMTPPYRAWSGDLRVELRKRFLDFLALAHSTAQTWPRSPGTREVYAGLLELTQYFRIENNDRH